MFGCLGTNAKENHSVCSGLGYPKIDLMRRQKDTKVYLGFGKSVIKIIDLDI